MDTPKDVVGRAAAVLRVLSQAEPQGLGTSEAAHAAGLPRATVHRLLSSLAEHGLVDRDPRSGAWLLGAELFLLGATAAPRYDVRALAHPVVRRLAEVTGESAFFSVLRGDETVCLIREDGAFPLRSHVLFEGARFPLGVVSAGIAVLAFLPEREVERHLAEHDLAGPFGAAHSADAVRGRLAEVRRTGWAVNPGLIVEGSWGMAAAVFDAAERPVGALSLNGVVGRFGPERQPELGRLLLKAAHSLGGAIHQR
ncbi:IclR family transcriptional regulator [Nocardioides zeae]|uniref:IclR family transcriptional regulator n=1 Tax=Nocardioides imazamoxiresistens TaxID=3231893 RepID=A0ABU3PWS8_9ACTN|nr:IclR family transcriptional regulator [Nocardioides zeae]MDT9593609.1 IclR family transcriptional regulator [Nocardioides zeae]